MSENIQEVLDELHTVRPEMLDEKGKRLFEAIMKIADERDKYKIELERLNNIINELEHHLYQEWLEWKDSDCESIYSRAGEDKAIYDYLQELKGSDKE